ncbi:hypothetical protein EJB05_17990 [Eragrostis curvula]|uniref:Uncharacterized protein n=1 Tax=Eragrostis curvula TaxID=38414 RepID=A0A5J9VKH9_9POAL|nr:hypothetical protein EJB05_17988 [Eragrostis curvula]TVU36077.1 hypothetical protein EJB05_17990 [Eragrostis curvula]
MAVAVWTLVLVVVAAAAVQATVAATTTAEEAVHAVLAKNQLPRGLLPSGIAAFDHDAGSGRFEAVLETACTARSEVGLRYNVTVTGVVSEGRIAGISGVAAKDLFMWFPVRGIHVDIPSTGVIYFDVGVVFKHFPLSVFDAPPPCTPDPVLRTATQRLEEGEIDGLVAGFAVASQ